jgi:hypothetical protein
MEQHELMPVNEFCIHYNAEFSFVHSLHQSGLIEITTIENTAFINKEELYNLEKFIHLHYDMDINLEGIEAINHLLQRINNMQLQINQLRNKLELM